MDTDSSDNLDLQYGELFILLNQEEEIRKQTEEILSKARPFIDSRKEFNKWLQTNVGQDWKQKQFKYQQSKCAYCSDALRFADAVVHHVLSLKNFGSAANNTKNFKLLHPGCNLAIGTKIVDFP
jgi:5-methylcytosine-specific restriction endonuclease McrA